MKTFCPSHLLVVLDLPEYPVPPSGLPHAIVVCQKQMTINLRSVDNSPLSLPHSGRANLDVAGSFSPFLL